MAWTINKYEMMCHLKAIKRTCKISDITSFLSLLCYDIPPTPHVGGGGSANLTQITFGYTKGTRKVTKYGKIIKIITFPCSPGERAQLSDVSRDRNACSLLANYNHST